MLSVQLSKRSQKFILNLPKKHALQIKLKIKQLLENPTPHDSKQLIGYEDLYRADIGEYRIIYEFDLQALFVLLVGKRNDGEVYKKLKRLKG
jgi:mRNA interferase RelE/StbE